MVRKVLWFTLAAVVVVFCVVQDRVTASGARRYVAMQKDALAGRGPAVTIDEIMRPAVARSVRLGVLSGGAVAAVGVAAALVVGGFTVGGFTVGGFTGRSGRSGK